MNAISKLCSEAILLDRGEMKEMGESNEVISDYIGRHLDGKARKRPPARHVLAGTPEAQLNEIRMSEFDEVHDQVSFLAPMAEGIALQDRSPFWAMALRRRSNDH